MGGPPDPDSRILRRLLSLALPRTAHPLFTAHSFQCLALSPSLSFSHSLAPSPSGPLSPLSLALSLFLFASLFVLLSLSPCLSLCSVSTPDSRPALGFIACQEARSPCLAVARCRLSLSYSLSWYLSLFPRLPFIVSLSAGQQRTFSPGSCARGPPALSPRAPAGQQRTFPPGSCARGPLALSPRAAAVKRRTFSMGSCAREPLALSPRAPAGQQKTFSPGSRARVPQCVSFIWEHCIPRQCMRCGP